MSGEAAAILGSILGAVVTMVVILTLRMSEMRERLGRLEEWVRLEERDRNGRREGEE